jgi:hypothetical protein
MNYRRRTLLARVKATSQFFDGAGVFSSACFESRLADAGTSEPARKQLLQSPTDVAFDIDVPIDIDRWARHADVFAMAKAFIAESMLAADETGSAFLASVGNSDDRAEAIADALSRGLVASGSPPHRPWNQRAWPAIFAPESS